MTASGQPGWWPPSLAFAVGGRPELGQGPHEWLANLLEFYDDAAATLRQGRWHPAGWSEERTAAVAAELDRLVKHARGFRAYLEWRRERGDLPADLGVDGLAGDLAEATLAGAALAVLGVQIGRAPFLAAARYGERTRRERSEGGRTRWAADAADREAERRQWRTEAAKVAEEAAARGWPRPSVSDLARAVKRRLGVRRAESTIRHALGKAGR